MTSRVRAEHGAKGFTILELLIATLVFSVVLMLVTAGILQMAKVYYKGVTESNTQNTARTIIDTISQAIQFSGGDVTATVSSPAPNSNYAFCIGNTQYSYRLGWQVEDGSTPSLNQTWHSLVQAPVSNCTSSSAPQNLTTRVVNGRDLVGKHMRLSDLVVTPVGANSYKVQVSVIYGDNDLLNNPTAANASCKSATAGSQFCASMQLSTIVVKRVK